MGTQRHGDPREDVPVAEHGPIGGMGQRFRAAFTNIDEPALKRVEMLPSRLAQAVSRVLPVDGVGLSVFSDDFRVPIGASDATASDAERLQFTYGDGPCLRAFLGTEPVRANPGYLNGNWPLLYGELVEQTPYRSVVALPMSRVAPGRGGAMDLYMNDPATADTMDLADATEVAHEVVVALAAAESTDDPDLLPGPAWIHGPSSRLRLQVWVAIGMINVALHLNEDDVLALLRAYAYAHDSTVDTVAQTILDRQLPVAALQ